MSRRLLSAAALVLLAATAQAGGSPYGYHGCGGACLAHFDKIHQHGPLFNYGPYYGYPPFEPYGPWNQYLQYGNSSGYGYSGYNAPAAAPAGNCPTCANGAQVIRPQLAPTMPAYGYAGSYNPYFPAYAPQQALPAYPAPVVPVMYPQPAR